jgi:hypothetical protein
MRFTLKNYTYFLSYTYREGDMLKYSSATIIWDKIRLNVEVEALSKAVCKAINIDKISIISINLLNSQWKSPSTLFWLMIYCLVCSLEKTVKKIRIVNKKALRKVRQRSE